MMRSYIESYIESRGGDPQLWLRVVCANGHVDNPIRYYDGRVAYDFPERVPAFIKAKVVRRMNVKRRFGDAYGKDRA